MSTHREWDEDFDKKVSFTTDRTLNVRDFFITKFLVGGLNKVRVPKPCLQLYLLLLTQTSGPDVYTFYRPLTTHTLPKLNETPNVGH